MATSSSGAGTGKWLLPLSAASLVSLFLFMSAVSTLPSASTQHTAPTYLRRGAAHPPSFAYFLFGGRGEGRRLLRLLLAVYHPRNRYLLHLSAEADFKERVSLAEAVKQSIPAAEEFGNVDVVGRAAAGTPMGASGLVAVLRAASALLKMDRDWDWFIVLNSADYPLVTQDDLIHVFSSVPRNMNFIDHTSELGWKETQRVQPIIVDAGIYLAKRNSYFEASEKRATPDSFDFFTGSPWVILSRQFIEYCILGWDNLPRTLVLYFTNIMLPLEGYFHTVICNSPDHRNLTVNSDLRYTVWDDPPQMEPHFLNREHFDDMIASGLPFARQFKENERVLDKIDAVLGRWGKRPVPGAWCSGSNRWFSDPCSLWSNANIVRPGPRAYKFLSLMETLLDDVKSGENSCAR